MRRVAAFAYLPDDQIEWFLSHLLEVSVRARDAFVRQGDPADWPVFSETANLHDPGIQRDFPSLRLIGLLRGKIGHWRLIPADSPTFESDALHACELLLKHKLQNASGLHFRFYES